MITHCSFAPCGKPLTRLQQTKNCKHCSPTCAKRAQGAPKPLCAFCRAQRVKRIRARFCSRVCAGRAQRVHLQAALAANRQRYQEQVWRDVIADIRALADADGRLHWKDVVKVTVKHRRIAYGRGYGARWHREQRSGRQVIHVDAWRQPA